MDFLIKHSANRENLEVDFFGGEPLMAWDTVVETVKYARSIENSTARTSASPLQQTVCSLMMKR